MRYIYFTKMLEGLDLSGIAGFLQQAGLHGADLAVRPKYPVDPNNVEKMLPEAAKIFKDQGLTIPLVSATTDLINADDPVAQRLFNACAASGVEAIKIGYYRFQGDYPKAFDAARKGLAGFAKLAEKTKVKACYHTHSGTFMGSNCEGQLPLLADLDPHFVGSYVDTGHQAVGGAPIRMALPMVSNWFALLAIKDMMWEKTPKGWKYHVVPAGEGIVNWPDVRLAIAERKYDGIVSLHGEYHLADLTQRLDAAKAELEFLKKTVEAKK